MQIESAPKLLADLCICNQSAGAPGINQGNGGLSESAWISRGKLLPARRRTFQCLRDSATLVELIALPFVRSRYVLRSNLLFGC